MTNENERRLLGLDTLAERWDMSKYSIRRLVMQGELKSVTIGARRLIPLSEVERAETFGAGRSRKDRKTARTAGK